MDNSQKTEDAYSSKEILQEERYLWMARAFTLVALLALIANVLMLIALSGLTPLVRVQPFYIQSQDKEHQVISVVRPDFSSMSEQDLDVLKKSLVQEYLLARYGIGSDSKEVEHRWGIDGIIFAMSETSVYSSFWQAEASPMLTKVAGENLTQDVIIQNVIRKRQGVRDIWQADMETVSMSQNSDESERERWLVKLEVEFRPLKKMEWSQRLRNPLGFTVTHFTRTKADQNDTAL